MEARLAGINRIIRILDEELTELQAAGLYRESEKTRVRLETFMNMRDSANNLYKELSND